MRGWQVYVWVFSVVLLFSAAGRVVLYFKRRELVSRFDVFEGVVALWAIPALFGFAYQRAYGSRWQWEVFCALLIVLSIYQFFTPKMRKLFEKGWLVSAGAIVLQAALGGTALWAMVRYAFFEPGLWP